MNPDQIREKMAQIQASLAEFEGVEHTDEQIDQISAMSDEFDGLNKRLEAAEKLENIKARSAASTRKVAPAPTESQKAAPRVTVGASAKDKFGGFDSTGDFLMAVKSAASGNVAPQFKNVMYEKNGEDGGFLVPEEIRTEIQKKLDAPESLLSRVRQFAIGGNALSLPIDESQPWNGGVQAYWTAEGAPFKESQFNLQAAHWRLHKLACMVKATDELLEDAQAMESYISNTAPDAIMHRVNESIISGSGVGKPTGLLNSPFTIAVDKEAGQAADTIVPANIIKMYSRMIPSARANGVWFINAGAEEQLMGMKNGQGDYIYLSPGGLLNQTPFGSLMGRPVLPMLSALPQIGDRGDIIFADLSYYYAITKAGQSIKSASSIHLHFDREITAFRFSMRLDGGVPFKSPVTTQYGAYTMSGIVTLADRA